ncbi:MAG: hypothetical protein JNK82_33480 [Myxococcaceae bacterium]|nr:hypothetical protein [Myxococcaceae bacterium]
MSAAALVIVLVGSGEAGSDWAAGTLQALREALDRRVQIELREELEPQPADAYVVSVELSRDGRRATLRCSAPAGREPKDLEFKKSDRLLDRGRAIGYALGALLPELKADARAVAATAAAPAPPSPPATDAASSPPAGAQPAPAAPATTGGRASYEGGRLGIEATAVLASSFVTDQPGFGGALAVELRTVDWLGVRLGGSGVFGNAPVRSSTLREVILRAGLRARLLSWQAVQLSVVAHALFVQLELYRNGMEQEAWRGGAELSVELALAPSSFFSVVLKPTARTTFGTIQIYVNEQRVGALTPFVFALELGVRIWP